MRSVQGFVRGVASNLWLGSRASGFSSPDAEKWATKLGEKLGVLFFFITFVFTCSKINYS